MARAIDPAPLWLEIGSKQPEGDPPGPAELDWIQSDHLFLADEPAAARPQDAVANMALLNVVRSDESPTAIARLADFVRLPPITQEILSRLGQGEPRHALAIANTDRVRREYPTTVEGVRPFVEAFLDAPVIPIFSGQGTPGAGRMAFDFVFQVLARDVEHWSEGSLVPEKAPGVVDLRIGVPIPLANIPGLADLFGATGPRKQSP